MTAEVNAPAAAACPHAAGKGGEATSKRSASEGSCEMKNREGGLAAEMMTMARHAATGGQWAVMGSRESDAALSRDRQVSSIPKSDFTPAHQTGAHAQWEYPSEEMYYRAMQRKGWDPEAGQMKTIVAIHNSVNEQSWHEVMKWERMHPAETAPKLKRFIGRPSDYSPKARLMNLLGWSVLPFDRHDWIVERDGKEVRYVIDFYSGQPAPGKPLSVYLDVRPALDSFEGALDRLRWQFQEHIQPLLPFRGALGREQSASTTSSGQQQQGSTASDAPPPSQGARSTVIPRDQAT